MNLNIVIIGLSMTSSWGNGHATTYRALTKALWRRGHTLTFLERDVPWYRAHRDVIDPPYCKVRLYNDLQDIPRQFGALIRDADLVIVGSYVPDGIAIGEWITSYARGITAFYDIDTPVTLAGLEAGKLDYISPALVPRFDLYLSFSGGPALALVEDLYGSPLARALYCSSDLELYKSTTTDQKWCLGYLGTYSEDRQQQLETFLFEPARELPEHAFVVAGSKYPDDLTWPSNIAHIPHSAPTEHSRFYCAQKFTLNVTRADMRALGFSPSVRLFEAAACGVPLISDHWPGLETIFTPSREILLASDPRDVIQILTEMSEECRLTIGEKARARILRDHTPDHRARQLETYYQEAVRRHDRSSTAMMAAAEI